MVKVLATRIVIAFVLFFAAWFCDLYFIGFFRRQRNNKTPQIATASLQGVGSEAKQKSAPEIPMLPKKPAIIKVNVVGVESESMQELLSASVQLTELHVNEQSMKGISESYRGIEGDFCALNFAVQKEDPTSVPMFRHLVQQSHACQEKRYRVDIKEFVKAARLHDSVNLTSAKVLPLAGAIFHESRCGSTVISNALQAMSPAHRVYSEAQPGMAANLCGDSLQHCSLDQAAELLKDVVYIMSRSSDSEENRVFLKFHSENSRNMQVFQHAFPETPWIFVFRNPVHIIVSQFKEGKSIAKCVRGMKDPAKLVSDILESKGYSSEKRVTKEVFCAATLASYCVSALTAKERAPDLGFFVHFPDIHSTLVDGIIRDRFGLEVLKEQEERIESITNVYSKASHGRSRRYIDDSAEKERKATPAISQAAHTFLQESYERLLKESSSNRVRNGIGEEL